MAGRAPYIISGVSGEGVRDLLRAAHGEIVAKRAREKAVATAKLMGGIDTDADWKP